MSKVVKTHKMTRQRCPYAVGVVLCRVLAFLWLTRDAASRVVLLPRASASLFLGVTTGLLGTITFTLAGSPWFPGICPVESIFAIGAVLQDAVRKNSPVRAAGEDGLYVDTLQALSRCR